MKSIWLAARIAAAVAISVSLAAAQAQERSNAPVKVTETQDFFTLDNGIVQAQVSKKSGDLVTLAYKGSNLLATITKPDGTPDFDIDPPGDPGRGRGMTDHMYGFWSHDTIADRNETKITIDPAANGGERGEVSVKGFSDGKNLGHGPGAGPQGNFAADIEIRYTLGRGDSGIYTYCIFDHKPEYPEASMGEARFCVKLNEWFDWMQISDDHNLLYPRELEASGDNKYNYTAVQWEHPAFGWSSSTRRIGFYFVNASVEYLTGPPTKVEFLCHRDTTGPLYAPTILNYWRSSHYGGGSVDVAKGEHWTKVIGPFMLYVNSGSSPQTMWADAIAQQRREAAKWPYDWVSGVDYPTKERAKVSGRFMLNDPQTPWALPSNLRVGLAHPDYTIPTDRPAATNAPRDINWQLDSKHYEFWARGSADGSFTIPAVRPGTYTLHAFADGILGEYAKADVKVEAGKDLNLGTIEWVPVRKGKQLWDIGIPNRSGSEFVKGNDYFHDGMEQVYSLLFPDDINYVVGKSEFARDWYYLHVPHMPPAAGPGSPADTAPMIVPSTQPGRGFGGFARGGRGGPGAGPATQPGGRGAIARGGRGAGRGAAGPGRGAARGGGAPGGGARPSPWTITFQMPTAARGTATLRVALAAAASNQIAIAVNGKPAGELSGFWTDSSIGRNAVQGIWHEYEVPFNANLLQSGTNTLTLTMPGGAGVIYDYLRLELDESTPAP
jgi:rhamnogalacturonan endolyase